jgi:hypothetical protein
MWSRKEQNISGFDRFDGERAHVSRKRVVVVDEPFGFRIGKKRCAFTEDEDVRTRGAKPRREKRGC